MKLLNFTWFIAAGAVAVLWLSVPVSAQDKADKKPAVVQVDLSKLPPDVAKRLLDEVAKTAEDGKKADKGQAAEGDKKADKGKGDEKPSKGKRTDKAKTGEKPSGDKKTETPAKGRAGEKPSKGKKSEPAKGKGAEKDK
jgi:hypothetical protein